MNYHFVFTKVFFFLFQEKKAKEAQKRTKKKESKMAGSASGQALEEFPTSEDNPSVPHFVDKCVNYIETEGKLFFLISY